MTDGQEVLKELEAAGDPKRMRTGVPPLKNIVIRNAEIRPVTEDPESNE
jgi:hypothetical protein